jgi:hypothetical protein
MPKRTLAGRVIVYQSIGRWKVMDYCDHTYSSIIIYCVSNNSTFYLYENMFVLELAA